MNQFEIVGSELQKLDTEISAEAQQKLTAYADELVRWNRTVNLTALKEEVLVRRLIAEPIWIGRQLNLSGTLADVGSGNGSPAVPLHVACSFVHVHLIEARARRAAFLRHIVAKLALPGVSIHNNRLEELSGALDSADWITLQAVAPTAQLMKAMKMAFLRRATTKIVWITSGGSRPPVDPITHLRMPNSTTEIWIFGLDQS